MTTVESEQSDLGGDFGGQIGQHGRGVAGVEGQRGMGRADPLLSRSLPRWLWEALPM